MVKGMDDWTELVIKHIYQYMKAEASVCWWGSCLGGRRLEGTWGIEPREEARKEEA